MRSLRAVYNHARKSNTDLPAANPGSGIGWNKEHRRNTGMGPRAHEPVHPWLISRSEQHFSTALRALGDRYRNLFETKMRRSISAHRSSLFDRERFMPAPARSRSA